MRGRATLRDWVIRFNKRGPDGLNNLPSPGAPSNHAKQFNRHRRQLRILRTRLGRLIRDIRRKIAGAACSSLASVGKVMFLGCTVVSTVTRASPGSAARR